MIAEPQIPARMERCAICKLFTAESGRLQAELVSSCFEQDAILLIYTAFTNLICNKEITYGRDK